jgi:hypothetical protein
MRTATVAGLLRVSRDRVLQALSDQRPSTCRPPNVTIAPLARRPSTGTRTLVLDPWAANDDHRRPTDHPVRESTFSTSPTISPVVQNRSDPVTAAVPGSGHWLQFSASKLPLFSAGPCRIPIIRPPATTTDGPDRTVDFRSRATPVPAVQLPLFGAPVRQRAPQVVSCVGEPPYRVHATDHLERGTRRGPRGRDVGLDRRATGRNL